MDGVLADFHKRYEELFGETAAGEDRPRKNFSNNWKEFIRQEQFATLDWFPGGKELLNFVIDLRHRKIIEHIEILSSTGGIPFHTEVRSQKMEWLSERGIIFPGNFVPGRKIKKYYAFKGNILIDDTPDVVDAFNEAGGLAILHKDVGETVDILRDVLDLD